LLLHPADSPDRGPGHDSEREERIVHAAAAALWVHFGLTGYEQGMTALGVPEEMPSPHGNERLAANELSQEMIDRLSDTER
jgi:hypothetical protein